MEGGSEATILPPKAKINRRDYGGKGGVRAALRERGGITGECRASPPPPVRGWEGAERPKDPPESEQLPNVKDLTGLGREKSKSAADRANRLGVLNSQQHRGR